MGSGPMKGFNSEQVQQIITKKHDAVQNKIAKEDSETATFAAGEHDSRLFAGSRRLDWTPLTTF